MLQKPDYQPRKRFGQHFLHDPVILDRLVSAIAPQPGQHLVEIGPGLGVLTLPLLRAIDRLIAIELDRDLIPLLQERCTGIGNLVLHQADAISFDFLALPRPLRILGNLPYNVATPILFHLLDQLYEEREPKFVDMHFLLQREVVERMAAKPGESAYGRLSVMVQYRCEVTRLFSVPAGAFRPLPKVESAVVRLKPHLTPPVKISDIVQFSSLVRQAFLQRRKTIKNNLRGWLTADEIQSAGVDPGARPEVLSLEQFSRLAELLA
ncbi:Ribosomal RNA small subunit methyltransferase A [Gammaproteobacteria bacterium]